MMLLLSAFPGMLFGKIFVTCCIHHISLMAVLAKWSSTENQQGSIGRQSCSRSNDHLRLCKQICQISHYVYIPSSNVCQMLRLLILWIRLEMYFSQITSENKSECMMSDQDRKLLANLRHQSCMLKSVLIDGSDFAGPTQSKGCTNRPAEGTCQGNESTENDTISFNFWASFLFQDDKSRLLLWEVCYAN